MKKHKQMWKIILRKSQAYEKNINNVKNHIKEKTSIWKKHKQMWKIILRKSQANEKNINKCEKSRII